MGEQQHWPPYCGQEFHGPVTGRPVICDSDRHPGDVMHRSSETGFRWWGLHVVPADTPGTARRRGRSSLTCGD